MLSAWTLAAALTAVVAQPPAGVWYGIAPDDTVPGVINLFEMSPLGEIIRGIAALPTQDREYVKTSTLHCSWGTDLCYFATGIEAPYTQDAIIAVDRTTGQIVFRHELPADIYIDNLQFDYIQERLFSIGFRPNGPNGVEAAFVEYDATTGNVTEIQDITRDLRGGFVYGGAVSICPTDRTIFVGVDARDGAFNDYIIEYAYGARGIVPRGEKALLYPITSGVRAFCSNASLEAIFGVTVQADSQDRETALLGDFNLGGREGLLVPVVKGDLPTYTQRGEVPVFLTGLFAEFARTVLVPAYAPFQPQTPIPYGALWTIDFGAAGPPQQVLSPLNYFLAGASGTPAKAQA